MNTKNVLMLKVAKTIKVLLFNVTDIELHFCDYRINILPINIWRYLNTSFLYRLTEDGVNMTAACNTGSTMVITIKNTTDISSPKYPSNYPPRQNCTWHIIADHDKRIQLSLKGYNEIEREYEFFTSLFIF